MAGREGFSSTKDAVWETLGLSALWLAFLVALTATLGSLYLSEVAHFVPCKLCWYQRIAMYSLVPILAIAAWKRDVSVVRYVVPLAIGAAISICHYQLERFPGQASVSCSADAPCTVVWIWKFHFVSIPLMALEWVRPDRRARARRSIVRATGHRRRRCYPCRAPGATVAP